MEINRLPKGEVGPKDSDCIKITETSEGRFELITSALLQCDGDDEASSEALISGEEYDSYEQAERAGIAWAEKRCVAFLYIEID